MKETAHNTSVPDMVTRIQNECWCRLNRKCTESSHGMQVLTKSLSLLGKTKKSVKCQKFQEAIIREILQFGGVISSTKLKPKRVINKEQSPNFLATSKIRTFLRNLGLQVKSSQALMSRFNK